MTPMQCPNCDAPLPVKNSDDGKIKCPLCGNVTFLPSSQDPPAENELNDTFEIQAELPNETVKYSQSPAMFRNSPILFILTCLLIPFIVGLIILLIWWLVCKNIVLTVTDKRVQVKTGLLSKNTNDIWLKDVRNVIVSQSFFQRLFGVGKIEISTSGQSGFEVVVNGIKGPQEVAAMIRECHS